MMHPIPSESRSSRVVLDAAIVMTAIALAIAVIASERLLAPWVAAWAYLVAVAIAAWTRSRLVFPIAASGLVVTFVHGDATVAWLLAQVAILTLVIAVITKIRRDRDDLEARLALPDPDDASRSMELQLRHTTARQHPVNRASQDHASLASAE